MEDPDGDKVTKKDVGSETKEGDGGMTGDLQMAES
jgi:hypothetical protein